MEVAGWYVGPFMTKIIEGCSYYLANKVRWKDMKTELESLRKNQLTIQAVVLAANKAQISDQNHPINTWIWELRDALDEVNDELDELEYLKHQEQLTKNTVETKKRKASSSKAQESSRKIGPDLMRLLEVVQKLDKVSADVTNFLHLVDIAKQEQKEQEVDFYRTRGYLPKNDLIGRVKEKELVMEWLRNPSNEHRGTDFYKNISILSVVGHGGTGKTTLLQHVYKDEEITKEFDLKMWVSVSNNFDKKKVITDMLECLKKERPRLETLDALQGRLEKELKSKKFLLVLDDIWEEDEEKDKSKWEDVLAPLASGSSGSKILITTRTYSVALMFAKVIKKEGEIFKLQGLEKDECLQLLNSHAFAGVENPPDGHKKLRAIAGENVKKLLGSPLAAKVIGGALSSKLDESHWRTVLESNLLGHNSIGSILRLSYIVLPNHLQNCFAFCGIFGKDHIFDKDDLVRMWIALGFIQPSPVQEETMEDIGGRYFDDLVKKSFFDKFDKVYINSSHYKMHDLQYELAQSVSIHECLRVEASTKLPSKSFETIRHLSVQTINLDIINKIKKLKHLHSLFLFYEDSNQDLCSALIKIFKASRCLRLLYMKMIPKEINYLKHLRYLKIDGSVNVTRLPRSLSNLYHLQYIILPWGASTPDDFLPSDINNLSNLRYMKLPENCISSICGVGKLKFLQELHKFKPRDVSGYRIGELENMNDLCKLEIECLENVEDVEEASSAKLCEKRMLTDLTLCWSKTSLRNIGLDVDVLDKLQPPKCLRNLRIEGYMGARWSAIWMNDVNPIFNLEKIKLSGCLECETLPPFGQLRFLKSLTLMELPKVKWLQSEFNIGNDRYRAFPLLEELYIWELEALEDWFEAGAAAEDDGCLFPCLIKLELYDCPKLKELPSLPSKLKRLEVRSSGWKTLNFCSNSNPIPLETLMVSNCPNITSLPLADEIARLAALTDLRITKCPNLNSLGEMPTTNNCHLMLSDLRISDPLVLLMEPLRSIASLKLLTIQDNGELSLFPNEVEQWFLNDRSSLHTLYIRDVPKLRDLPKLPLSLKSLTIIGECHPELKERYGYGGSHRHKIAHIPYIDI